MSVHMEEGAMTGGICLFFRLSRILSQNCKFREQQHNLARKLHACLNFSGNTYATLLKKKPRTWPTDRLGLRLEAPVGLICGLHSGATAPSYISFWCSNKSISPNIWRYLEDTECWYYRRPLSTLNFLKLVFYNLGHFEGKRNWELFRYTPYVLKSYFRG